MTENQNQTQLFTAAQIARGLGKTRQAIQKALAAVPPSGVVLVAGNEASAWGVWALPGKMQQSLATRAAGRGYRNTEAMLAKPPEAWQPAIPIHDWDQAAIDKAVKLRAALGPSINRSNQDTAAGAFERRGVEDYAKAFGYAISTRRWRDIWKRTIERDGGAEDWQRLEIYLDELIRRKEPAPETMLEVREEFAELEQLLNRVAPRIRENPALKRSVWEKAFEIHQAAAAAKPCKRRLLQFLEARAPFMAKTSSALRVAFDSKFKKWLEADQSALALKDQRERSGYRRGPELTEEQWQMEYDRLIAYTVAKTGGRISQAWREMIRGNQFHPKILEYHLATPAWKSYVPKRFRDAARTDVRILDVMHHGKKQHRSQGAHLDLDWTATHANQAHCADDATLPVYWHESDGQGWYRLQRGQFLVQIDMRSLRVLGFVLIPERNYTAFAIHTLYTRTWSEFGLPEIVLHEGGIWDKSRLLKGKQGEDAEAALPGEDIELGLREFGIKFRHAREARAKTVERVIGLLQDRMEREPGYVGRDEIKDRYECTQRQKMDVEARRMNPEGVFYSFEQWVERLQAIVEDYNADPQDGKILQGLSPSEAFERFQHHENPPIRFDAHCRFLLAHYKRKVKVTRNGITLRIGKNSFNYHNRDTGRRIGQEVLAWFNPEAPEVLTVTDVNQKNPFSVARSEKVPALTASDELLAQEMGKVEAHQGYGRERYKIIKANFKQLFRTNVIDRFTKELGEQMAEQQEAIRAEKKQIRRNRRLASEVGLPMAGDGDAIETGDKLARFKAALAAGEKRIDEDEIGL